VHYWRAWKEPFGGKQVRWPHIDGDSGDCTFQIVGRCWKFFLTTCGEMESHRAWSAVFVNPSQELAKCFTSVNIDREMSGCL
jgi:hypothetical protein